MLTPNPRHSGSRWEPLPPAENVAPAAAADAVRGHGKPSDHAGLVRQLLMFLRSVATADGTPASGLDR